MSTAISISPKRSLNRRVLVIGLIVILGVLMTTGFVWVQVDHTIAPPGLRMLDWLWRLFVCRCHV